MEEQEIIIDPVAMRAYILDKFVKEGDYDFMQEGDLEKIVSAMADLDAAYMDSVGDGVYDDDEAYEKMFPQLQKQFPDYKMYCMRLCEDYLDFSEEYLASIDAIDWE